MGKIVYNVGDQIGCFTVVSRVPRLITLRCNICKKERKAKEIKRKIKATTKCRKCTVTQNLSNKKYQSIKERARKINREFSVSKQYLSDLLEKQNNRCALSGILLTSPCHTSLDRIDSSRGYVEGNVQWLHIDINAMKRDFLQSTFVDYCRKITRVANNNDRRKKDDKSMG